MAPPESSAQLGYAPALTATASVMPLTGGGVWGAAGTPGGGEATCGDTTITPNRAPADILIVLDRSSSMNYSTTSDSNCKTSSSCTPRWSALTTGLTVTLNSTAGSINWGLKLFSSPSGGACDVTNAAEVPIDGTSVPKVEAQIAAVTPGHNTPTAQAIRAATAYLKTVSDQNTKYILLSTDGEPNCGRGGNTDPNVPDTVTAITEAKNAGI